MNRITWECGVPGCGYTSPKKRARDLHIRVKHRPRQFKCDLLDRRGKLCSSEFAKESQLRYHVKLVHTPTEELKYACNYAGCGKRFFSAAKLQSHVTTHERKEQRQKAEIEKAELQEGLIFDLNENPCSPWLKEINKLRLAERNRIPELETEEIIPREFSSYMMKQVQGYNEAMIRKKYITVDFFSTLTYFCSRKVPRQALHPMLDDDLQRTGTCPRYSILPVRGRNQQFYHSTGN